MIFYRTFEDGFVAFWEQVTTPAGISALNLSLIIVAIVVPLNVIFGVVTALALARGNFRGKRVIETRGRPALRGLPGGGGRVPDPALGRRRLVRRPRRTTASGSSSRCPGMVIATIFVTLPFVIREVSSRCCTRSAPTRKKRQPRWGATWCQTFWRVTFPSIRWGLPYGVVLTVARSLGEFGAVIVVAGGVSGESQTLTLLVHARYIDDHNAFGAYAAATVLMVSALALRCS